MWFSPTLKMRRGALANFSRHAVTTCVVSLEDYGCMLVRRVGYFSTQFDNKFCENSTRYYVALATPHPSVSSVSDLNMPQNKDQIVTQRQTVAPDYLLPASIRNLPGGRPVGYSIIG